jgi:hypothetical protein
MVLKNAVSATSLRHRLKFSMALCDPSQLGFRFVKPQMQSVIPIPFKMYFSFFSMREVRVSDCFPSVKNRR